MNATKLGIAVIGSGRAGMIHARNFVAKVDGARLVAMVDPVPQAREAALSSLGLSRGYADYQEALLDPAVDAVVVVTPTVFHHPIVVAAAAARKHVLCEKPMAMDAEECRAMIAACDAARVKLQLGFMRRFAKDFVAAKQALDSGAIGDPVLVKSLTRGPSVPQPWMYDIAKSNGPLAEVNSHDIDALRWMSGDDFSEVYAVAGNYRCPEARASHPDFYDNVVMTVRFARGAQGMIDGAQGVGYAYDARLEVLGTKGVLLVGALEASSLVVCGSDSRLTSPAVRSWRDLFTDAYLEEDSGLRPLYPRGHPPEPQRPRRPRSRQGGERGQPIDKDRCAGEALEGEVLDEAGLGAREALGAHPFSREVVGLERGATRHKPFTVTRRIRESLARPCLSLLPFGRRKVRLPAPSPTPSRDASWGPLGTGSRRGSDLLLRDVVRPK